VDIERLDDLLLDGFTVPHQVCLSCVSLPTGGKRTTLRHGLVLILIVRDVDREEKICASVLETQQQEVNVYELRGLLRGVGRGLRWDLDKGPGNEGASADDPLVYAEDGNGKA
jgi:hypothetical protein